MKFKDRINVDLLIYVAIIVVSVIVLVFLDMNKFE